MALLDDNLLSPLSLSMLQMADLLQAEQSELDLFFAAVEHQENQLYICTCDSEFPRYERMFALSVNTSLSISQRRTKIIAKLNSRASATVKTIKEIVMLITHEPCVLLEHFAEYSFTIKLLFADTTTYYDFMEIGRQISEITPAHLDFDIVASYSPLFCHTHNDVRLISLKISARINCFGVEIINLDGRKNLDGTWRLIQVYTKGIEMKQFYVSVKALNLFSTSAGITTDTIYYLDGVFLVDGKKRLDADIIRSEI